MPNGNSPQLQIPLMAENDTLKYLLNNEGFNAIDNAINRILAVDMTAADVTLTESQFTRNVAFKCSGHVVPRLLTVPSTIGSAPTVVSNRFFIIVNDGTGALDVSGGVGINKTVQSGTIALVLTDGTDVYLVSSAPTPREFQDEGVAVVSDPTFVNFVGNNVSAAISGGGINVTVNGVAVDSEGVSQTTDTSTINFTGSGVTVTPTGSAVEVIIPSIAIQDEGIEILSAPSAVNFVGTGVSVSNVAGVAEVTISSGGATTFTGLTDTPVDYVGQTLKALRVNAGETALEFVDFPAGGGATTFTSLTDTPVDYVGQTLKAIRVNAGETALEFVDFPAGGGATTFTGLTDTPVDYVGQTLKAIRVNAGETALEFVAMPAGLPVGGTADQVLAKIDGTDYNTQWVDAATPAVVQIAEITTARVALSTDFGGDRIIYFKNAAAATYTINSGLTGTEPTLIVQDTAAGAVTITAGAGVTLKAAGGLLTTDGQYAFVSIIPDEFNVDHYYVSGRTV